MQLYRGSGHKCTKRGVLIFYGSLFLNDRGARALVKLLLFDIASLFSSTEHINETRLFICLVINIFHFVTNNRFFFDDKYTNEDRNKDYYYYIRCTFTFLRLLYYINFHAE